MPTCDPKRPPKQEMTSFGQRTSHGGAFKWLLCENSCWNILRRTHPKVFESRSSIFLEFKWFKEFERQTAAACLCTHRDVQFIIFVCEASFLKQLLVPAAGSQTEPLCSIRCDGLWSSRSRVWAGRVCANISVSESSGTPSTLSSQWTGLQQGLLGRARHPMTPLGRTGHLKEEETWVIVSSGAAETSRSCWTTESVLFKLTEAPQLNVHVWPGEIEQKGEQREPACFLR